MNDLIAITKTSINGAEVNSVNAKELYKLLEVKTKSADWIKRAIDKYDFQKDVDFISVLGKSTGGRPSMEVFVTIEMAKELAMMENNPKGKQFRKYFIEVEKQSQSISLELQAIKKMLSVAENHETRLNKIENNSRLTNQQECALIKAKNVKVYDLVERHSLITSTVHRRIWQLFKKKFSLPRYNELPNGQFQEGLQFINSITVADLV